MPRRSSSSKGGVNNAAATSARKASTMRTTAARDGTDGTKPTLKGSKSGAVSGKVGSTVGQKGGPSQATSKAVKSGVSYSTPAHSGGYRLGGSPPKLGRSGTAVSGLSSGSYGTAKAKNTARSNSDHGKSVSGLDNSFGTAPARNRSSEPYGTAPAKGPHHS